MTTRTRNLIDSLETAGVTVSVEDNTDYSEAYATKEGHTHTVRSDDMFSAVFLAALCCGVDPSI